MKASNFYDIEASDHVYRATYPELGPRNDGLARLGREELLMTSIAVLLGLKSV